MTYAETYRYQAFKLPEQPRECHRDSDALRTAQEEEQHQNQQVAFDAHGAARYDRRGGAASNPFSAPSSATSSSSGSSEGAADFWSGSRESSSDCTDTTSMSNQLDAEAGSGVDELADSLWELEWDLLPPPSTMPSILDGDKFWMMMETGTSGRTEEAGAAPGHLFSNDNCLGRKASTSSLSSSTSSADAWPHPQSFTSATAGSSSSSLSSSAAHSLQGDTFNEKARRHLGTTPAGRRMHWSSSTQAEEPAAAGPAAMLEQAASSSESVDQLQHQQHTAGKQALAFTPDDRNFYPQAPSSSTSLPTAANFPHSGYPAVTPQPLTASWQQPDHAPSLSPYAQLQQSLQDFQQQYQSTSPASVPDVSASYPYYNFGHLGATTDQQQQPNYFGNTDGTASRPMTAVSNHSSSSSSSRPHSAASQHSFAPSGRLYSWSTGNDGPPEWAQSDPTAAWQQAQQPPNQYHQPYQAQAYPSYMQTPQHQHVTNQPYGTPSEQSQGWHMPYESSRAQSSRQSTHTVSSTGMPIPRGQYDQVPAASPSLYHSTSYWQSQTVTNSVHIQTDFQPLHSFRDYSQPRDSNSNFAEISGRMEDLHPSFQAASTSFTNDAVSPQLINSNHVENAQHGNYGSVPRSHFTTQLSDSAAPNSTAASFSTNRDAAPNSSFFVNENIPVQSTAAFGLGLEERPLHFDYSKPGSPKPLARLATAQPKTMGKKKSSLSVEIPPEVAQSNNDLRMGGQSSDCNANTSHTQTNFVLPSPSESSDSGASSLFSKGQKRRRPGPSAVKGRDDSGSGTSLTSAESLPSGSSSQIKDSRNTFDTNRGNSQHRSTGNNDSTVGNYMQALPQIATLQLNGSNSGHNQPQPYSYASSMPRGAPPASVYGKNEPPSPQAFDEGGNDLHSENDSLEKSGNSGRRLYECKLCPRKFPRPSALVVHERIHSGEKPFICEFCGRPFTVASNLRRHQKIHAKEQSKMPAEEAVAPSRSSDESTIKGPPATRQRLDRDLTLQGTATSDSKHLDTHSDAFLALEKQPSLPSVSGDPGDSDGDSYEEGSEGSSPITRHFDLPNLRARDYAISTPAPTSTSKARSPKKEQECDMQQSLDEIRQWSRKIL